MATEDLVRRSFLEQASLCDKFGSAFMGRLLRTIEATIDRSTETGRTILDWKGNPEANGDALALRLAGALHGLVLAGSSEALSAIYPPNDVPSDETFRDVLAETFRQHDATLRSWLALAPQTNEVGRSSALFLGLMHIVRRAGLPVRLFEIGSSGGLNLVLDRYAYVLGGLRVGNPDARLVLEPDWEGAVPQKADPEIASRRGCDLSPLDLTLPADRLRLRAYVWPDQAERLERLSTAIEVAAELAPPIDARDGVSWVREQLTQDRPDGSVTVLMHSLTFCYLPQQDRDALTRHMETLGADATETRPLAWLSFELSSENEPQLKVTYWPGGQEEFLAEAHPHCRWLRNRLP